MTDKRIELIASLAHTINAAYCLSIGDDSQPKWEDAPEWQKQSAINGVNMHLQNPDATPEQSHEGWMQQKEQEGWKYGEVKDEAKKEHPCFLPYDELPQEQKSKDFLFRGVVHAVKDLPLIDNSEEIEGLHKQLAEALYNGKPNPRTSIKYIGRRSHWSDTLYGTGLTFIEGQTRVVPPAIAEKFLNHPDVFELGQSTPEKDDTQQVLDKADSDKSEEKDEERNHYAVIDQLGTMTREGLIEFAMSKYGVKLSARLRKSDLHEEVSRMVSQLGVP